MRKNVQILIALFCFGLWVNGAQAEVVIKVRALNPLTTKETAVINYPLPKEISKENIFNKKITYSLDHSEDEEKVKESFQISLNEETGGYFIDDKVNLLPKEVVTLEVHVKDVWKIEQIQVEGLQGEVDGLLEEWESQIKEQVESEEEKDQEGETKEFALMMKQEILDGLEKIILNQKKNSILNVGVEKHISAYEENLDDLRQIQQDIVLLANLIQFDVGEEGEAQEENLEVEEIPAAEDQEAQEPEDEDAASDEIVVDEVVMDESIENKELVQEEIQ